MTFRLLVAALLALMLGQSATAASIPDGQFEADRFRAHVAFLADDRLEGRDTGSRGLDIAADYVASQFASLGLLPGGEQGGWFQKVPLRSSVLAPGGASVTVTGPAGSRTWRDQSDVLVGPSAFDTRVDVSAPVVFVGYGIDAPRQGIDDYRGLDVRGKIVAVLAGAPNDLPSELGAWFQKRRAAMAAGRGAIAMITLATSLSDEVAPWDLRVSRSREAEMTWLGKDGRPADDSAGLRAAVLFNAQASEALFAGAQQSYAQVRADAERPRARPRGLALPGRVRIESSSAWTEVPGKEVIGLLRGSDPKLSDQYVVLMGHLDHLGVKADARPGEDRIYNGALDNAAGIATMLEAARAFAESGKRPRRSILFIANTAEEKGLLGAGYFARNPTVPIDSIVAVVDLDMPLLLYDFTDVIAFGAGHSTVARAVAKAAKSMGIAVSPDPMPEQNIFVRSDHYRFVEQGIPAILLATGFANGGEAKWRDFLRNTYHDVDDDLHQPINWEAGARYARLNYLISRELADSKSRPRWYEGDFFGETYAPRAPKARRGR